MVMWFHSVEWRQGFAADLWNDKDWVLLVLKLSRSYKWRMSGHRRIRKLMTNIVDIF